MYSVAFIDAAMLSNLWAIFLATGGQVLKVKQTIGCLFVCFSKKVRSVVGYFPSSSYCHIPNFMTQSETKMWE